MVDRITKINPHDHPRVDESGDATDDESGGQTPEDEGEAAPEQQGFQKLAEQTGWKIMLDHPQRAQRKVDVAVGEVGEIRLIKLNLKTNPSLVNARIALKDGTVFASAYISLPRHMTVPIQQAKPGTTLDGNDLTVDGKNLAFFVPELRPETTVDEITRVTLPPEKTLSQTLKMLIRKTWLMRIGVQDPDTKTTNREVLLAYLVALVVLGALGFAVMWMLK